MASCAGSRAEEQPPALPVKQHRSHSSRCSSVGSDCFTLSPVGLQNYSYSDVFPEPTDCHAAQCPIHQRYDPSQHQARFFSDGTPPPVPKKKLARTLSLPGTNGPPLSPLSPLSPLQRHPQNFDNPLYMLAPKPDPYFLEEEEEFKSVRGSPVPLPFFSQLSFDTPDEHLPHLFSGLDDQRVVSQGIQHRHLLFLRSMARSVEAGVLLQREATERDVSSYQPQDFQLCEGSEPAQIGDTVYYSLHSPKLPGRMLGLRVQKQTDEASSAPTKHQSLHVNVQDVIAHFQASNTPRNDSSAFKTQDPSRPFRPDCTVAKPPGGGSTEHATAHGNIDLPSVQSFLQKGLLVSVERDLPNATLEDFVQDNSSLQSTHCLDYDRQVCALLLQILMGTQHLCISATAAELRPQGIFLVWPNRENEEGDNKLEQDAPEIKRGFKSSIWKDKMEWRKTKKKGKIQMLWRTHGSPRVVLTPLSSALSDPHSLTDIKSQIGALIQYCLHSQGSLTPPDPVPTVSKSLHRRGLLYLASLLQSESSGPQMADMVAMLQALLWGPNVSLFNHRGSMTTAVHNWLTIKRALLVMKLAERGLIQDQSALDWEDCMCLQYLSFTDPKTVMSVTSQLWLTLNMDSPS
ncbi:inactive tyrosine-protein kinase PRAG1 [Etheostoma spectabile]|uniref:inactive tyrosine-protein kinase PRAG1 n=1 Tax=Etheostoma spectabile TaxID=54343 RepID=UPI0013AFEBAD|nr:inactive tyrosine-protein kinase PRAG1-like [Etheostoma spectabile]